MTWDRLHALLQRILSYPRWEVGVELLLIGLVVWAILRFVSGTRAAGALKGLLVVVVLVTVAARIIGRGGGGDTFQRLEYLYDRFLAIVAIALIVIFQPELRRALIRLGETPFFRSSPVELAGAADEIAQACAYLAKSRFGAIIAIERQISLKGIVEGGTVLGAELSARLLQTIFFPGAALHDLAVIVKGNVIHAAGVQLPLADPADMPDLQLGSRHRAAVGLSKECDAIVVVVSEETGQIRIAERGRLSEPIAPGDLRDEILRRLRLSPPTIAPQTAEEMAQTRILDATPQLQEDTKKEDAA
jgi:diadenylate cyclase